MIFLYSLALGLGLVVSAPWWLWKMATAAKYREGLGERLGFVPGRLGLVGDGRRVVWVHAVSVGEVIAANGLVKDLRERVAGRGLRVVVSTTTRTGQRVARERFGAENVFYFPLDFGFAVRAYLRALRPAMLVLVETEFWPRVLWECGRGAVPVAVVNARISDRSYPRYWRMRFAWRRILRGLALVLAQTAEDAVRLRAIGVPAERVRVGGNLKYDVRAGEMVGAVDWIREALPEGAKVLVCGSTLEGEERLILEAWPGLVATWPELRMVLAPRHPERFGAVAELLERSGVGWFRRSEMGEGGGLGGPDFPAGSVLLLDSIGELASVYSVAAVAFVGGSLVAGGGHNPLEPAQFGVPVLMGEHYANFRGVVEALRARDGIRIVEPGGLGESLRALLGDEVSARAMGARGRSVFEREAGATARAVESLMELLSGAAD